MRCEAWTSSRPAPASTVCPRRLPRAPLGGLASPFTAGDDGVRYARPRREPEARWDRLGLQEQEVLNCALTVYRRALWTTAPPWTTCDAGPCRTGCSASARWGTPTGIPWRRRPCAGARCWTWPRRSDCSAACPAGGARSPAMMERPAWTSPHRRAWSGAPARGARRARGRARAARGPGVVVHRALPEGPAEPPEVPGAGAASGRAGLRAGGRAARGLPVRGALRLPHRRRLAPPAFSPSGTSFPADRLGFLARARTVYGALDADPAGRAQPTASGPCWAPLRPPRPAGGLRPQRPGAAAGAGDVLRLLAGSGAPPAAAGAHDRRRGPG